MPENCQKYTFSGLYGINIVSQEGATYRPTYSCTVTVSLSRKYFANITISKFELESPQNNFCKDYVNIFNAEENTGNSLTEQFCGTEAPFYNKVFNTSAVTIYFKTNKAEVEKSGFRIEIRRVLKESVDSQSSDGGQGGNGNTGNNGGNTSGSSQVRCKYTYHIFICSAF